MNSICARFAVRDSSIPWLSNIPANWERAQLLCFIRFITSGSRGWAEHYSASGSLFIRIGNLTRDSIRLDQSDIQYVDPPAGAEGERTKIQAGDLLFSITAYLGSVAVVPSTPLEAYVNQHIALVRLDTSRLVPRFAGYATLSVFGQHQLIGLGYGGTKTQLALDDIKELWFPIPPLFEQSLIADYLDREMGRLDRLVAAKERVLGLLAEKRRALITRAATRGLDPRAPLRASGIPWLGEIPAHWETRRVAWLFRERDERDEPHLPLLEVSINTGVALREFSEDRIESTAADFNTYKVARKGDVVFNKMRMWQGAVGVAPEDGLVSPDYTVAAPSGTLLSEYAGQLFRTELFSAECARRSHGIVWDRLRLYWDGFSDIELPLPPQSEQRAILAYIENETGKLDVLHAATERTIALLKERRAVLIAAAVTGKITDLNP